MKQIVIWGATGHARVVAECAARLDFGIAATVDRRPVPPPLTDVPFLLGIDGLNNWLTEWTRTGGGPLAGVVAIGGPYGADRRAMRVMLAEMGLEPLTLIHPLANMARDASVGPGSQVLIGATIAASVKIGASVIVNSAASIDHDCVLGDGVHIAPGAVLAGEVTVGQDAFVGAGVTILPKLSIGAGATVGAGAVVTRSVQPGATVVGVPARPLER